MFRMNFNNQYEFMTVITAWAFQALKKGKKIFYLDSFSSTDYQDLFKGSSNYLIFGRFNHTAL